MIKKILKSVQNWLNSLFPTPQPIRGLSDKEAMKFDMEQIGNDFKVVLGDYNNPNHWYNKK